MRAIVAVHCRIGSSEMSNDRSRTMLKVGLEEVPSSTTYRAQQLKTMGETVKSLPPNYQAAITPLWSA